MGLRSRAQGLEGSWLRVLGWEFVKVGCPRDPKRRMGITRGSMEGLYYRDIVRAIKAYIT